MNEKDGTLATLTTVPSEFEAQLLVNLLGDRGIAARTTGASTAQFRAEAPGLVRVLVKSDDLAAARSVVQQARIQSEPSVEDPDASERPSGFRRLVVWIIWTMLIWDFIGVAVLIWSGLAGGYLPFSVIGLAISVGVTVAILWGFRRA
jgi:hypothetical protein